MTTPLRRWLPWVVAVAVAVLVGAAVLVADRVSGGGSSRRDAFSGFDEVAYRVERGAETVGSGCALLAATEAQHRRGLMNVRDLRGYDGMIFRFPSDTSVAFYMKDTPMPLSIAWFDGSGRFISGADMVPNDEVPRYTATARFRYAFEVPQGRLGSVGIGAGSTLLVGGSC